MFDLLLALELETGKAYTRLVEDCVEEVCESVLEVTHNIPFTQILHRVHTDYNFLHTLYNVHPGETDRVEIRTADSCSPVVIYPNFVVRVEEEEEIDCYQSRSPSFMSTINFWTKDILEPKELELEELKKRLEKSEVLKPYNMEVSILNSNLLYVYNPYPQKNIVLRENYWEKLSMLASIDRYNVTFLIESFYGSGFNPPHEGSYRSSSIEYREEVQQFFLKLKDSL